MFPNPHDALPLPQQPNLEQYKKRAKELVKATNSGDTSALREWVHEWIDSLVRLATLPSADQLHVDIEQWVPGFEEFVRTQKSSGKLSLSKAQFVLARTHGFDSWSKFTEQVDALARRGSAESDFEAAADAIAGGDLPVLARLLRAKPALVHLRSTRQHRATLLHYVAANGVEGYRQKTPRNAAQMAQLLLDHGADVNAEADVYGGGATTLELVATSIHPERAGVQQGLMQLLLDRGASGELAGRNVISACFANARPLAAEFLARRGLPINLEAAAGLGRLDLVKKFFEGAQHPTKEQRERGLSWACEYGKNEVVRFLLKPGVSVQEKIGGQTKLHWAVIGGNVETVQLLLAGGAKLETKNQYGGTALGQALWCAVHGEGKVDYVPVVEALVGAGAKVSKDTVAWVNEQKSMASKLKGRILELLMPQASGSEGPKTLR